MFQKIIGCAGLLSAFALVLPANVLNVTLPTVNETSPTVGGTLTLPQFDSSLGTLTGVSLDFGAGSIFANTSISDVQPAGGTIDITYNLGYQVTFNLPVGGPFVPADFQQLNCTGSGTEISACSNSLAISLSNLGGTFDLSSDAAAFLAGSVAVTYTPSLVEQLVGSSTPTNPANLVLSVTGESLTMPAAISYTYTPDPQTPEPSAAILSALGLLALVYGGRQVHATAQPLRD